MGLVQLLMTTRRFAAKEEIVCLGDGIPLTDMWQEEYSLKNNKDSKAEL